jgi:hypothetical protein
MRKLFRSFERAGLDYLLISGQATVLYGAATFSEDVDLWIRPTPANARKLLIALADQRARVHRLTPKLTSRNMKAGHGFHFVVPGRPLEAYLDIMAKPPRVGSFGPAKRRARRMRTDWGTLPVVHPVDLVEIKKTRRLADYDIITNLVSLYLAETPEPSKAVLRWAAENCFRPEERAAILARIGRRQSVAQCAQHIAQEVLNLQARDRAYWSTIIRNLRKMRRSGKLLPDGIPVARLIEQTGGGAASFL